MPNSRERQGDLFRVCKRLLRPVDRPQFLLRKRGGKTISRLEPVDPPALLVNGDPERSACPALQRLDQAPDLPGRPDIAPRPGGTGHFLIEQNDAAEVARGQVARDGVLIGNLKAAKAGQEHLADFHPEIRLAWKTACFHITIHHSERALLDRETRHPD